MREKEGEILLYLTAKAIESAALPFQSIDHIHRSHSLPFGVLCVGDGITDDVLKEDLEDTTGLLIDEARDTLDSTTASQTADSGLGDALDVIPQHLTVPLRASLSQSLASFAASSHVGVSVNTDVTHTHQPNFILPSSHLIGPTARRRFNIQI